MTEDVAELTAEQPAPVRSRWRRAALWLVVVAVLAAAGTWTGVVAHRDHWLDARRQITMHQLNIVGHPPGFHSVQAAATDPGPSGWDGRAQLGRRYYDGTMVPADMTVDLDYWLGRAGLLTANGPREAQRCLRLSIDDQPTFGCENFYRETPEWRVWISVTGQGWPGKVDPAFKAATPVHLMVVVAHKQPFAKAFTALPLTSPGLSGTLAGGSVRTVLALTPAQAKQVSLDGATFGPAGQLVTAGPGQPAVIPAGSGSPAQILTFSSWASVAHEVEPVQTDATVSDVARIASDGSLYVHYAGYGLRRLGTDGAVSTITGVSNGNGQLTNGPAAGQDPYTVAEPTVVSADGTVWVANGQLVRIRTGKLHIIDPSLQDVRSVTDDGHNGVYFATATRVFHLTAAARRTELATGTSFTDISSLAVAKDGSVYVLDADTVRRVIPGGEVDNVAGRGGTVAGRDDPVFCALPVPAKAADLAVSAAYDVIASPLGGVYLTGCNRLVQIGPE
jgi:hypothetical protein